MKYLKSWVKLCLSFDKDKIYNSGKFDWCLDIEYPLTVKNRCVFFYSTADKYRAVLNESNYFGKDNNICVIFLYGKLNKESLFKYIKQINANLVIIHYSSPIFDDTLADMKQINKFVESFKKRGMVDEKTGTLKNEYVERLKKDSQITDELIEKHQNWVKFQLINERDDSDYILFVLEKCENSTNRLKEIQKSLDLKIYHNCNESRRLQSECIANGTNQIPLYLENLIYYLYPYGVEVATSEPYAYKSIAVKRIIKNVLSGKTDSGKLNINLDSDSENVTISAVKIIQAAEKYIDKQLRTIGYFHYSGLIGELERPPYGYMQDNNWYAYVLAMCLSKYKSYYQKNALLTIEYDELQIEWLITSYRHQKFKNNSYEQQNEVFIYKPNQKYFEIIDMISELINDKTKPKTITSSIAHLFTHLSKKQDNKILPLTLLNTTYSELAEITYSPMVNIGGIKNINYVVNKGWFQSESVNFIWHFLKDNYNYHKKILSNPNDVIIQKLYKKYPDDKQKVNSFILYYNKTFSSEAVWLYDKEFINSVFEEYMKKESIVCKECGRYLVSPNHPDYVVISNGKVTGSLSQKEIIGLNLKLIDRHASSYYCLPCLSEITECSESALWQKVQDFKEEGCTLF